MREKFACCVIWPNVDELMFVRENGGVWQDVAPVPLGRSLLSSRS